MLPKLMRQGEGKAKSDIADEGGRGVRQMLMLAEEGGRGGLDPPFLADVICEQPLIAIKAFLLVRTVHAKKINLI